MTEKILIVDDEPNILKGYVRSLRKNFIVDTADSGQQALLKIKNNGSYAIIIADMKMPRMSGLELLSTVKYQYPYIIRVMLTGNADQKTAVDAVNKGEVFKFLTKPCSPQDMIEVLNSCLVQYRQTQKKQAALKLSNDNVVSLKKKLSYQAQHDYLTGLANRQAFEQRVKSVLELVRQNAGEYALCTLDLDDFHVINDTCGYTAGDECLRQMGDLLSSQQRSGDVLARVAANQFCILLINCCMAEAEKFALSIQKLIRKYQFEWEGELFNIKASIGLVPIDQNFASVTDLFSAAETACYVVKDRGGNNLHIGMENDDKLTHRLVESQQVSKINRALRDDLFILYYQLIVPIGQVEESGEHYEILIRMTDDGQLISPAQFLPAAENFHLSPQIDCWVIHNLVEWLCNNPQQLEKLSVCSINLSGHSLGNSEVLEYITETFANNHIPPEKICFEITETAAISHLNDANEFIRKLKLKGFRFSLDDFGSGLSSFAYLKNFPVDYLKIDGQFVKHLDKNPVDRAMVKSINGIAKAMGKITIAEYVENREIHQILDQLQVDFAQGYYLGKPKPLNDKT